MNPRRVHKLMSQHFPAFDAAAFDWVNVVERDRPSIALVEELLQKHVSSPEIVVEVHRKLGAFLPKREALAFVCAHIGEGQIRIANREFTSFVVIALNGVATGWQNAANPSMNPTDNGVAVG